MVWICRLADCKVFEREEAETVWRPLEFVVILNTELKVSWCLLETAGNHRADTDLQRGQRTRSTGKKLLEREYRQVRGIKAIKTGSWQNKPATSLGDAGLVGQWWSKPYKGTRIIIGHMMSGSLGGVFIIYQIRHHTPTCCILEELCTDKLSNDFQLLHIYYHFMRHFIISSL